MLNLSREIVELTFSPNPLGSTSQCERQVLEVGNSKQPKKQTDIQMKRKILSIGILASNNRYRY
jgi:hypothetical protein